jgi:hypothetical protein
VAQRGLAPGGLATGRALEAARRFPPPRLTWLARRVVAVPPVAGLTGWGPRSMRPPLFSLHENAIAKEPGAGYAGRWRCVS